MGKTLDETDDIRGTTMSQYTPDVATQEIDSTRVDWPAKVEQILQSVWIHPWRQMQNQGGRSRTS